MPPMRCSAPDNRPREQVTLRVLDSLPGEDDVLAELATRECRYQFDAWVKEKMAAGKQGVLRRRRVGWVEQGADPTSVT